MKKVILSLILMIIVIIILGSYVDEDNGPLYYETGMMVYTADNWHCHDGVVTMYNVTITMKPQWGGDVETHDGFWYTDIECERVK